MKFSLVIVTVLTLTSVAHSAVYVCVEPQAGGSWSERKLEASVPANPAIVCQPAQYGGPAGTIPIVCGRQEISGANGANARATDFYLPGLFTLWELSPNPPDGSERVYVENPRCAP